MRILPGKLIAVLLALVGLPSLADGTDDLARIQMGPNRLVSVARSGTAHYEVVLACDPNEPQRIVIASMAAVSPENINLHEVATFASSDGGNTWEVAQVQKGQVENESYFDPHLVYGSDGSVYRVVLRNNPFKARAGAVEVARSDDGGKTWNALAPLKFADRPFLVADCTGGKRHGQIHCIAAKSYLLAAVSRDGGQSFTDWKPMLETGRPRGIGNAALLSNGELVVSYPLPKVAEKYPCPVMLTVARSTDGGQSFREVPRVAEYTLRDIGSPSLAVDASNSTYKDHLYLVWPDDSSVGRRVRFSRSVDMGKTWSQPTVLSEQSDEGDAAMRYDAFLPSVAVNKAGVVGLTWYDARGLPPKTRGWNIRFRASLDGGETWLPSVRVTDEDSIFPKDAKSTWAGDTAGLAADANGDFRAAWVDCRTGVRQIWTTAIRVEARPQ